MCIHSTCFRDWEAEACWNWFCWRFVAWNQAPAVCQGLARFAVDIIQGLSTNAYETSNPKQLFLYSCFLQMWCFDLETCWERKKKPCLAKSGLLDTCFLSLALARLQKSLRRHRLLASHWGCSWHAFHIADSSTLLFILIYLSHQQHYSS